MLASRRALGNALMEQLLAAHEFALPATMVEGEVDRMLDDAGPRGRAKTSEPPKNVAPPCGPKPSRASKPRS